MEDGFWMEDMIPQGRPYLWFAYVNGDNSYYFPPFLCNTKHLLKLLV